MSVHCKLYLSEFQFKYNEYLKKHYSDEFVHFENKYPAKIEFLQNHLNEYFKNDTNTQNAILKKYHLGCTFRCKDIIIISKLIEQNNHKTLLDAFGILLLQGTANDIYTLKSDGFQANN